MTELSKKALEFAITQIGKEEQPRGSNWGDPVRQYLKSVDINFPASWCMAFVYYSFMQADFEIATEYQMPPKTGGVLNAWRLAPKEHKVDSPQPGDIFIMDLGHGLGHTGIVEKVNSDGSLGTIEGNTNDSGSREGYEVCRKIRQPKKPIIGYLRY